MLLRTLSRVLSSIPAGGRAEVHFKDKRTDVLYDMPVLTENDDLVVATYSNCKVFFEAKEVVRVEVYEPDGEENLLPGPREL